MPKFLLTTVRNLDMISMLRRQFFLNKLRKAHKLEVLYSRVLRITKDRRMMHQSEQIICNLQHKIYV